MSIYISLAAAIISLCSLAVATVTLAMSFKGHKINKEIWDEHLKDHP
jgi:hypothetical protein